MQKQCTPNAKHTIDTNGMQNAWGAELLVPTVQTLLAMMPCIANTACLHVV